jgi:hypothetical protein
MHVQSISISIDTLTDLFSRAESVLTAILLLFILPALEIANDHGMTMAHLEEKVFRSKSL